MILSGHIQRSALLPTFGPAVDVKYGERRGRRVFWPITTVRLNYSAALRQLRALHGPGARFKREDQAGLESWQVLADGKVFCTVGAPDWAGLLAGSIQ